MGPESERKGGWDEQGTGRAISARPRPHHSRRSPFLSQCVANPGLKRIRPAGVVLSQSAVIKFFDDGGVIGELESYLIVEFPFVGSVRMESQCNAAVPDLLSRFDALDLQGEGVG